MGNLLKTKDLLRGVAALVALGMLAPALASAGFYIQSDRPGYYWGKDPVEPEGPEQEKPKPQVAAPKQEQKEEPKKYEWESRAELKFSDFTPQQLWDMKPKELAALLEAFKDQSVWRPTEEHVHDTYAMIDIARRKSSAFANVQQYVVNKYPEISTERDYPMAVPGKEAIRQAKTQEVNQRVAQASNDYGLIYFYKPGCPYCEAEEKILRFFVSSRRFDVQPVNIQEQPGVAAQFGITITPSLVLIKRGNSQPLPISYGVIALDELEARVFNGVRLLDGQTTPEQYGVREYERGGAFDPTAPLNR
ncbi:conjugal transfer protein TraF [Geomonas subterranea]|uniref:conjugal transfer protein TraF n=1 Tax=Geomonas subterranea TaxID=2847989 RepID=UPI001CD80FDA|nr:conjugal transfer protein TraF [Geomonas fuzhouensis]